MTLWTSVRSLGSMTPPQDIGRKTQIALFGSCRVHDPLRALPREAGVRVRPMTPHVHNASEMLQWIRLLKGECAPPPKALWPVVNINLEPLAQGVDRLGPAIDGADAVIIELSSVRVIELHGWSLQITRVRSCLRAAGLEPGEIAAIVHDAGAYREGGGRMPDKTAHPLAHDLVSQAQTRPMKEADIRTMARRLVAEAGRPVLFVGFCTIGPQGAEITIRRSLNAWVKQFAGEGGCDYRTSYFDPTPEVRTYGPDAALLDSSHYAQPFMPVMGEHLAAAVRGLVGMSEGGERREWQGSKAGRARMRERRKNRMKLKAAKAAS